MNECKYPPNWPKVSRVLRRLAAGRCEWCHRSCNDLSVHHIGVPYADGRPGNPQDKHDLRRENLAAICFSCHDGVEHIRAIRHFKRRQKARRHAKLEAHRALGIGTGLILVTELQPV